LSGGISVRLGLLGLASCTFGFGTITIGLIDLGGSIGFALSGRGTFVRQALVVDLLPAGFEIENTRLSGAAKTDQFAWLGDLSTPSYAEFRDDRYVAAVNLDEDHDSFVLAYLVRAVTPGTYRLPGSSIEDMYRPNLRARTAMGNVTVMPYSGQSQ